MEVGERDAHASDDDDMGYQQQDESLGLTGEAVDGPPQLKPDHSRCILHFDIDSFYAQVEEVLDPRLRGKPIGIRQKYLLVTCNYTARRLGARKMESVVEAKRRCPSLIIMDGEDLTRYREASETIFSYVAGACGPLVQQLGMDEIFADITTLIEAKGTTADSAENVDISTTARTTPAADETTKISAQSTQARAQRSPGKSFTGHLYSPGTGGHLLEAQTGLEISLGTGSTSGDIRSRREIDNDRPYRENAGDMINHCETRFLGANSRTFGATGLSANPRMTDCAIGDADETMVVSDQNDGIASSDVRSSEQRKISETAAFVDQEASSECAGRCRCGCIERLAAASAFAERVRRGLRDEVGYTCSAGIGSSKAAAKLAGELHKPDQQTTILPEHFLSMISQLPLRKLPGCGHSTCAKIKAELGITETQELQSSPWPLLVTTVGQKLAKLLYLLSRGADQTPVVPSVRRKTMSDEDSFKRGSVTTREQVERHIKRLSAPLLLRAGERVQNHKEAPETLRVGVRRASKGYGHRVTRQCAISSRIAVAWGAVEQDVAAAAAAEAGGLPASWKRAGAAEAVASRGMRISTPTAVLVDSSNDPPIGNSSGNQYSHEAEHSEGQRNNGEAEGSEPKNSRSVLQEHQMDAEQGSLASDVQTQSRKITDDVSEAGERQREEGRSDDHHDGVPKSWTSSTLSSRAHVGSDGLPSPSTTSGSLSGTPQSREQQENSAIEALLEVVRLAMHMFDKICPPGEQLNITLLSVGFANFRNLGGSSQTGIARFLETPAAEQGRRVASRGDGWTDPYHAWTARGSQASLTSTSSTPRESERRGAPTNSFRAVSSAAEEKHSRHEVDQRSISQTADAGTSAGDDSNGFANDDWEDAEVLVVGAGGQDVPGLGKLGWCWPCEAHILQNDMEEHLLSEYHRTRMLDDPQERNLRATVK